MLFNKCKNSSITLRLNNNTLALSIIDLCRLKQIQICIESNIIEKQKKINYYSTQLILFNNKRIHIKSSS
jgi:hypothetical protein